MTAVLEDVRHLPDADLIGAYRAADDVLAEAILSEAARRDRADRLAAARGVLAAMRHEAECAVHAQYLAASDWTRGRLLSRAGMAAGIAERDLWRLPADRASRFWSEELGDYFTFIQPRITVASYMRARAAEARVARTEARDAAGITTEEATTNERDHTGPELAGNDARPLRHVATAEDAQGPGGPAGPIQRGGRGDVADASQQAAGGTGRPGRAVRLRVTAPVVNGRQLTAVALAGRKLTLAWIPIN